MKQVTKTCKSSVLLWMSVFGWVGGASVPTYPITQMYDLGGQVYSKTSADSNTFGDGGGISNGTLNITFTSNAYWTVENKTLTVGPGGTLDVQKFADGNGSGLMIVNPTFHVRPYFRKFSRGNVA